ncbi:Telomeric repeat-binding factor 1 TTAGGG repeat-binding factor 1 [Channa argus]|uniref:Telomeric repeat-binding factor n=1 Tax=Channa argus TaxID=215402 RepID=A0A6G1QLW7_CHAAH|nr:Telomeric repeat-binding factor 1 TTAGGG repeat-binding factor 1 [Channa argus]
MSENNSAVDAEESVSFSRVTAVVTDWMLDFLFVSLCRSFKEGKLDDFNVRLSSFEAICHSPSLKGDLCENKKMITAFLARVMHGKQLDVQFEEDENVMPLMSAAKIWSHLEDTVADKSVFKNITILLLVQSVAVCLENGQITSACSALKWLENNQKFPQNVRVKLSKIVKQKETYHPFLMNLSYSCLLEKIQCYLDAYLEKNPCDYLLKAATKIIQLSTNTEDLKDMGTQESSLSKKNKKGNETATCLRRKRKLLSTTISDVWKPDTCKKPYVYLRRISKNELSHLTSAKSVNTSEIHKRRKPPQKWTPQLDKYLKAGVERHGQGKWARILLDFDFEGRTGTMLKDRWRVLTRSQL